MEGTLDAYWGPFKTRSAHLFTHISVNSQYVLLIHDTPLDLRHGQRVKLPSVRRQKVAIDGECHEGMLVAQEIHVTEMQLAGLKGTITAVLATHLYQMNFVTLLFCPLSLQSGDQVTLWSHHEFPIQALGLPERMFEEYQGTVAVCSCSGFEVNGRWHAGLQSSLPQTILSLHLHLLGVKETFSLDVSKHSSLRRFESHFRDCLLVDLPNFTCISRLLPKPTNLREGNINATVTSLSSYLVSWLKRDLNGLVWLESKFGRIRAMNAPSTDGLVLLKRFKLVHESLRISYIDIEDYRMLKQSQSEKLQIPCELAWITSVGMEMVNRLQDGQPLLTRLVQLEVIGKRDAVLRWVKEVKRKQLEMFASHAHGIRSGILVWIDPSTGIWQPADDVDIPRQSVHSTFFHVRQLLEKPAFGMPINVRGIIRSKRVTSGQAISEWFHKHYIGLPFTGQTLWLSMVDCEDHLNSITVKLEVTGGYPLGLLEGTVVELQSFRLARDSVLFLETLSDSTISITGKVELKQVDHEHIRCLIPLCYARDLRETSDAFCHLTVRLFQIEAVSTSDRVATLRCVDHTGEVILQLEELSLIQQILQLSENVRPFKYTGKIPNFEYRHGALPYSLDQRWQEHLRSAKLYAPLWHVYGMVVGFRTSPPFTRQIFNRNGVAKMVTYQAREPIIQVQAIVPVNMRLELERKWNLVKSMI